MIDASIEIIKMLREAGLGWIADELVESLALGKQTTKDFHEPGSTRATKATTIQPFSAEEELEIVVETLAQYFIVMPHAGSVAREYFSARDTFAKVDLKAEDVWVPQEPVNVSAGVEVELGIAGDDSETFKNFSKGFLHEALPVLRQFLSELWPHGAANFDARFCPKGAKENK